MYVSGFDNLLNLFKHAISYKFVFFFCVHYKYAENPDFIKKENLLTENRIKNKLNINGMRLLIIRAKTIIMFLRY